MTWAHKAGERLRAMRSDEGTIDALIALLHWLRGDRVERPWRLTRRQRVEMEAALASLRLNVLQRRIAYVRIAEGERLAGGMSRVIIDGYVSISEPRILRARVAIALRAALRADEDARCEEALRRAGYGEETGATPGDGWDVGYDEGARAAVYFLREWDEVDRAWSWTVPLALWEVVR